ncbi:MAG: low molecular weight phosphatase family protein [Actinobacteria bacterium]|nr:low molecular weight phosphatase family protein [Actinomycetota bacterium]
MNGGRAETPDDSDIVTLTPAAFEIVYLCTGNRCRSPMAEAWTRHLALQRDLPLVVGSAGTLDLGPVGSPTPALDVMQEAGIDLSGHRARPLATVEMATADLVIGFERYHVAAAVVDGRVPYGRAFTLIELVRLLETSEPFEGRGSVDPHARVEGARRAVDRAHGSRGEADLGTGEDLPDPFGAPASVYVVTSERIAELSERLLRGLFG